MGASPPLTARSPHDVSRSNCSCVDKSTRYLVNKVVNSDTFTRVQRSRSCLEKVSMYVIACG